MLTKKGGLPFTTVTTTTAVLLFTLLAAEAFLLPSQPRNTFRTGFKMSASSTTTTVDAPVQSKLHANKVLEVTLSRPKQLNALSSQMLLDMTEILREASDNPEVHTILLTAVEGRAFCAGGDIKEILASVKMRKQWPGSTEGCDAERYITIEYELDSMIHHLSTRKVVVAVGDGIIMGGGAGVFQGAGIRVVTPRCLFAMPECRIALLPDAGAMYFLHRAPGALPMYLALTGARLNGREMQETGLATHLVAEESVQDLLTTLRTKPDVDVIAEVKAREIVNGSPSSELMQDLGRIANVFGDRHQTVRGIYDALVAEKQVAPPAEWIDFAIQALENECPASHVVTHHAINKGTAAGPAWTIDRGLGIEFVANCVLGFRDDFIQGVDCAVGDKKGQAPAWTHGSWEDAAGDEVIQALLRSMDGVQPVMDMIAERKKAVGGGGGGGRVV